MTNVVKSVNCSWSFVLLLRKSQIRLHEAFANLDVSTLSEKHRGVGVESSGQVVVRRIGRCNSAKLCLSDGRNSSPDAVGSNDTGYGTLGVIFI